MIPPLPPRSYRINPYLFGISKEDTLPSEDHRINKHVDDVSKQEKVQKENPKEINIIDGLPEEDRLEYQRLKGIEDLAMALGKEVPGDVKEKLEQYEKEIGKGIEKKMGKENEIINEGISENSEILDLLAELGYPEKDIKLIREKLISELQGKTKEVSGDIINGEKTNKEIRSEFAEKYYDKLKKVHKTLDSLTDLGYPKEAIEKTRERLLSNLQGKLKLEKEDRYREVKKRREYVDTHVIVDDFRKKCVIIEENAEMMGYKGKKVHIKLPAIGNFGGFKLDYFVSDDRVSKRDFDKKSIFAKSSKLENKSFSEEDVSKISKAIEKYIIKCKGREREVLHKLAPIIGLGYIYWLKDLKTPSGEIYSCSKRLGLDPVDINNHFIRGNPEIGPAQLLLKLSD